MPNNLAELESLLGTSSNDNRNKLGQLIEAPFGNSAGLLCDHLIYLRSGAVGQLFDSRDYKQLVTDVADRVGINWNTLLGLSSWDQQSSRQIEDAIASHVDSTITEKDDTEFHVDKNVASFLNLLLSRWVAGTIPMASLFAPETERLLFEGFSLLSTDWRKLVAAVLFINIVIRPEVEST
jgi:hypothetical protein